VNSGVDEPPGVPPVFEDHLALMLDLQRLALQSDLTRVISFMISKEQSARPYPQIGVPEAHHPLSHHGDVPELIARMSKINRYHTELFAKYLARLRATPDGDGSLLDNSMLLYGSNMSNSNAHDHYPLPNVLVGGKRPRTTLSPTMALRDGEPYLAWGSPGGDQQDQWITQFFLRHVHAKLNLQEAIDAPAWHSEHFPSSFWPRTARPGVIVVEGRVPKATQDELKRRGHKVEVGPDWSEGRLTAASRDGRRRRAAANPRGMQGYAAGR